MAGVHRAEQALGHTVGRIFRGAHSVAIGHDRRLVHHVAKERTSIQVERIVGGETHFDGATVIFEDVNSAAQKTAVEKDVAGGGFHAHVVHRRLDHLKI